MPAKQFEWLQRIKEVEREHAAMKIAASYLLAAGTRDPMVLNESVRMRDVSHATERLESTYIIRLFAEFETALRIYWLAARHSEPPRTRDLFDSVAAKRAVPHDELMKAHSVRKYRNCLVHERDEEMLPISLAVARSHLCKFFAHLPLDW
jgi:hypothetical protein